MLYKMTLSDRKLEALPFLDFADLGKLERDLEELLANNLLDVLFEDAALMPIFRERPMQAEADLYALNRAGNLVIFELKRGFTDSTAALQVLRYAQDASTWTYGKLEEKYRTYRLDDSVVLAKAHSEAFDLERALLPSEFNTQQQLCIVGNAADDTLISAVDYWKQQGVSIDFLPYRIYSIDKQYYFEFFSLPYDRHHNAALVKGVLFDSNRGYNEEAIWEMIEKERIAAYGDVKHVVDYIQKRDIVFYSHQWEGIVAAAEVVGTPRDDGPEERYCAVKFLTPVPSRDQGVLKSMPFSQVSSVTGKKFFWARTIKVPYLNREEAQHLLTELMKVLE